MPGMVSSELELTFLSPKIIHKRNPLPRTKRLSSPLFCTRLGSSQLDFDLIPDFAPERFSVFQVGKNHESALGRASWRGDARSG